MNFTLVGLGKLGTPIAAAIASRGHKVLGVDLDQEIVDKINAGIPPVQERNLEQTMTRAGDNFRATTNFREALKDADIVGVLVPTPSKKDGTFSHQHVLDVCVAVGEVIRETHLGTKHVTIAVMSTLMPGTMEGVILPDVTATVGISCGQGWGLVYTPELVAIGNVIADYFDPSVIILGEHAEDSHSGDVMDQFFHDVIYGSVIRRMHRMSLTNAEITKMSINTFVSMKITFANLLGDICEGFPSGDIDVVSAAVGADSRIGRKYFTAGMPYGGTCFPRDVHAFEELCEDNKVMGEIAWAIRRSNKFRARRMMKLARSWTNPGSTVAILGLSYKPGTTCTIGSPSLIVAQQLTDKGYKVVGYNPFIDIIDYPDEAEFWSLTDCLTHADVIMIATQEPVFQAISQSDFKHRKKLGTIIDCWRILRGKIKDSKKIRIRFVGVGGMR